MKARPNENRPTATPPLPKERAYFLFGAPVQGEDVEAFLSRLDGEMDRQGLWNPDGTLNVGRIQDLNPTRQSAPSSGSQPS